MDASTRMKLDEVRSRLERDYFGNSYYPSINCVDAARRVSKECPGMQHIEGYLKTDFGKIPHHWNYCPESNEIVDLAANHDDSALPKIVIIPADTDAAKGMYEALRVITDGESA